MGTRFVALSATRTDIDENGAVTARHDYHPFGEEIGALAALPGSPQRRTATLGYTTDTIRRQFTGYERDTETDLDFAQARYYNKIHGRFTSSDPIFESIDTVLPQSMNRYAYVVNNPLIFVDPNGELWMIVKGQQNPQWVNECPKKTTCFNALALENEKGGLNVYGSKNANDVTEYDANKEGQIDVRKLSQHPDTQFIVADGQNVPEEYLSVYAAGSLFNIAEQYHQIYPSDEKLIFTAGNASDGKPGNCNGKPCHNGHKGNDIDLRYMDSSGKPLQGDNAYKNADIGRTNWLIHAGKAYGFPYSYTGDESRFGRADNTPKSRSLTEKVHRHHLHIGKTAPRKK